MKKIILPILSILTLFASPAPLAKFASAASIRADAGIFSLDDLFAIKDDYLAERSAACNGDPECEGEFVFTTFDPATSSGKYNKYTSLEDFLNSGFLITSINPSVETVKVYYNKDVLGRGDHFSGVEPATDDIAELYIGWLEDDQRDPNTIVPDDLDKSRLEFVEKNLEGIENPGGHLVFAKNVYRDLGNEITIAPDEETELSIKGANLAANTGEKYGYTLFFTVKTLSSTVFTSSANYEACVTSPNYEAGMECRLHYDTNTGGMTYLSVESEAALPPVDESTGLGGVETENPEETDEAPGDSETEIISNSATSLSPVKAPQTGTVKHSPEEAEFATEVTWAHISAIFGALVALSLWCFLQKHSRTRQKAKKS
ncbi:MAG: hypothetical protein Q4B34_02155 [Candidatus Saccharibacteria bacterium]|nr:hypothetical protein [Candidatus Saccharibacteria bacterium]